jgi:hypothetical protein
VSEAKKVMPASKGRPGRRAKGESLAQWGNEESRDIQVNEARRELQEMLGQQDRWESEENPDW